MHTQPFVVELLEDLAISERAATLGGHRGLDYVPGQTLLGACAARLYKSLGNQAYAVFHSGAVRFGNAYCLDPRGQPAWPVPLCWHQKKAQGAAVESGTRGLAWLNRERVYTLPQGKEAMGHDQPKQLRDGYVSAQGELLSPRLAMRMKTAIEPGQGRAAEGQLFGYQALARGTRLGGWIEADERIDKALFGQVLDALAGTLLLGRSRSAEYGRARLALAEPAFPAPQPGPGQAGSLTLWLLSDLALSDAHGQPTLEPSPENLGLGNGQVDWDGTFLRSRRYAPWNGKRGAPDLERWVIRQGSVIRLALEPPGDRAALLARCNSGLGLYRECGLGRVWVDPPLLADPQDPIRPAIPEIGALSRNAGTGGSATPATHPAEKDPLILWLRAQTALGDSRERIESGARELADDFRQRLGKARRELGIAEHEMFGPSRSQWGRVLETARSVPGSRLMAALFDGDEAAVKPKAEGWQEVHFDGRGRLTLADWLKSALEDWIAGKAQPTGSTRDLPRLIQRLAHLCRTDMEKRPQ